MNKYTKAEILNAVKKLWVKEYGELNDTTESYRSGYFVAGFVEAAIERLEKKEKDLSYE